MQKLMYKGLVGTAVYHENYGVFCGEVEAIEPKLCYEGANLDELIEDFHVVVDLYLAQAGKECNKINKKKKKI